MDINLIFDAAASANTAAAAAFRATMEEAASILDSTFTDNITVNLNIDYSGTGGGAAAGPDNGTFVAYSTVYNYLTGTASPGDSSFTSLPVPGSANAPTEVVVWNAQLKAMSAAGYLTPGMVGYISPTSTATDDGSATFATDIRSNLLLGVALHELTHAMGRVPYSYPDIMELDRFSSAGARVYDGNVPASEASYFSINGGKTEWAQYGVNSDPSDFLNAVNYGGDGTSPLTPNDAFNQYYTGNTLQYLTPVDLELMDTLGFHLKFDAPAEDAYDFNGSNSGDILLQSGGGQIVYANMAGGSFQGWANVANTPGWQVVGEGKISGNFSSDIVIQNGGEIYYANLVNGSFSNWGFVANTPGYNVVGVGDINDDHYADVVIQNSSGQIFYANMDNGVLNNWVNVANTPGWTVVAVADISYDGFDDIVIENKSTGQIQYANMDNGVFNGWVGVADTPGWNVVGAGDITGQGDADVVVQDQTNGQILFADMQNGAFSSWGNVGDMPGWNVIAVEDILGNGFDDIVIQNPLTGQIEYANMTGGTFQGWVAITSAPGYTGLTGPAQQGTGDRSGESADTESTQLGQQGDGGAPSTIGTAYAGTQSSDVFNTDPGTPINENMPPVGTQVHLPMYGAWLDGNSSSNGGFGPATTPDLPLGAWEAVHYANNSMAGAFGATDSGTQDNGGSAQYMVGSLNPAIPNGFGGAADFLNNQNGSQSGASPTSASWLMENAQNCSTPTNGAAQVPSTPGYCGNPAPIVTADNLQNLLHSGSNG